MNRWFRGGKKGRQKKKSGLHQGFFVFLFLCRQASFCVRGDFQ